MWLTYCHLMVKSRNQLDRGCKFSRIYYCTKFQGPPLTLNLLTTTIVAPPSNASKWQMGFNLAFKWLNDTGAITTWESCWQQTGSKGGVAFSDMSFILIFTETSHLV